MISTDRSGGNILRRSWSVLVQAIYRFYIDDGWAIASHIALSALVALFPFLIILTNVAAAIGTEDAAAETIDLFFTALPDHIAAPLTSEIHTVIAQRDDLLTVSIVILLWLASSGVEALRVGLNRAYGVVDPRSWLFCRLQSMLFVFIGLLSGIMLGALVLFWPIAWNALTRTFAIQADEAVLTLAVTRYVLTTFVLSVALVTVHWWIPAGARQSRTVWPGVVATLSLWLATATVFGYYMSLFFKNYAATYAGLASIVATLLYLYLASVIFVFGGNLNSAITRARATTPSDAPRK